MNLVRYFPVRHLPLLAAALAGSACSSWKEARAARQWALYVKEDAGSVDLDRFEATLVSAFEAVEDQMGPFERRVRVHALAGPDEQARPGPGQPGAAAGEGVEDVPGIGAARVRAWHVRGAASPFAPTGVFLATAEVGTAIHELVHARLAELGESPPLWFEEGLATLLGDGVFFEGRWIFDGLACWPFRELREQDLSEAELERLLGLSARDDYDARDNLLVHFVGWAVVFDLQREAPDASWQALLDTFQRAAERDGLSAHARARIERTLSAETAVEWCRRLSDSDPGVRLACAKGCWKLRNVPVLDLVLEALGKEEHPETRAGLALNALLCSSEIRVGRARWRRLSDLVFPALRETTLPDATEQKALADLHRAMRWSPGRSRSASEAFEDLARFWQE